MINLFDVVMIQLKFGIDEISYLHYLYEDQGETPE